MISTFQFSIPQIPILFIVHLATRHNAACAEITFSTSSNNRIAELASALSLATAVKGLFRQRRNYPPVVEHRIPAFAIALRSAVIDSSLVYETQSLNVRIRTRTHTIPDAAWSHARDSSSAEMKLRRGVDIPPVPLLNWNLIARPRRSITVCIVHRCKSYDERVSRID